MKPRSWPSWGRGGLLAAWVLCQGCAGTTAARNTDTPSRQGAETPDNQDPLVLGRAARDAGDYAAAERAFDQATEQKHPGAALLLGDLHVLLGRPASALALLGPDQSVASALVRVKALRQMGRLDEALAELTDRNDASLLERQHLALVRGDVLLELGRRKDATEPLVFAAEQGARIASQAKSQAAVSWTRAGRAAHLLREPELANESFNRAELAGGKSLELLLARFDLYLQKHDEVHAEQMLVEATERWPHHPAVLFAEARLHLEAALDYARATELAERILHIHPESSDALFLLAGGALRDLDFVRTEQFVSRALATNPRDLRALSLRAGARFLAEDPAGFEAVVDQVLALSPGYAQLFSIVAKYAEWEHRYPDIERMMRRAARLDREDADVRSMLGLTLVRWGSDAAGVVELRRAYDLDPFDVRVVNTLNLYERAIPDRHQDVSRGPFRYRFPKDEFELLERYVPPLLELAYEQMVARYGYTPQAPIGIEIYDTHDAFAVRTSGLPQTPIAGVCFGRKLATVSPVGAPGNLGMTLWHELGHVFHIGLSNYRVPRWLTEGLAEWETASRDIGWSRELDRELYQTLEAGGLPPLENMSHAFTHARHVEDIASAYYASGLLAEWLVQTRGPTAPVALLREMGKQRLAHEVIPEVLESDFAALDREFRDWLNNHLARFDEQFVPQLVRTPSEEVAPLAQKSPGDRNLQVRLAHAFLSEGNLDAAATLLRKVDKGGYHAQAVYLSARIALAQGKLPRASELLTEMVQRGDDGYEVRIVLARTLLAQKQLPEAREQLDKAALFDPKAEEPLALLAHMHQKRGDADAELEVLLRWVPLAEHAGFVHRRLMELLLQKERFSDATRLATHAVWADLANVDTHRWAALAWSRAGNRKQADFEWESALLCPGTPPQFQALEESWTAELRRTHRDSQVATVQERIAEAVARWADQTSRPGLAPSSGMPLP